MKEKNGILSKLASSQGRRDEEPNVLLAAEIAKKKQVHAVSELVDGLGNRSAALQNDCIKVLYELGSLKPDMIAPYTSVFLLLLKHKNNRLQWGGMTALAEIVKEKPASIYAALPVILEAAQQGSVITRDYAVNILVSLSGQNKYATSVFPLLLDQLAAAAPNQLPMYAERTLPVITAGNKAAFLNILQTRCQQLEKESQRKRLEKLMKKLDRTP